MKSFCLLFICCLVNLLSSAQERKKTEVAELLVKPLEIRTSPEFDDIKSLSFLVELEAVKSELITDPSGSVSVSKPALMRRGCVCVIERPKRFWNVNEMLFLDISERILVIDEVL